MSLQSKITYILIPFFGLLNFLASSQNAVDGMMSYSREDASLEEIFMDLEKQYGIRFSYATSSIQKRRLNANFKNVSIDDIMRDLLAEEELEYKIVDNNILVKKSRSYSLKDSDSYHSSLHIRGKVTNKEEESGLAYATISVTNSPIGTYSEQDGSFDIEIPKSYKDENVIIKFIGFEDQIYKISELEDEYLIIAMQGGQISIDEIMIVNKEKPISIGNFGNSIGLNKSQISSKTSGLMGGDIGRQIQLLAGISAHEDNSAAIKIRGSNSDETLMILDGMPIYNAEHYYGAFSGINANFVDSINLYKNTYPIQYGGRTAGLVEIFSERKQPVSSSASLSIDFLTASGDAKIPLTKNSHISLAGRTTLKAVNNQQFNTTSSPSQIDPLIQPFGQLVENRRSNPDFTFYDINARYQYRNDQGDKLSLNFYKSDDEVHNQYKISVKDQNAAELNLIALDNQTWSNTAASIIWTKRLSKNIQLHTTSFYTQYENNEINDLKLDKRNKNGGQQMQFPLMTDLSSEQSNELNDLSLDSYLTLGHGNNLFKIGATTTHHDIFYEFKDNRKEKLKGKEKFFEMSGYFGHETKLFDKFTLNTGLRTTYYTNLKEARYSPRMLLTYSSSDRLSFKTSYSIENQVVRQFFYEYRGVPMKMWVSTGENEIPVLQSKNIMLGTTLKLNPFVIDVELYQKDISGQLEYLLPNPGDASNNPEQTRDYKLFKGNGLNRGIDVILSSGYKNYDTYLSYTLSRSEQQFVEIYKNRYFASENDRTHQLKWVNSLTTGKMVWGFNGIYVSGRPYTDVQKVGPGEDVLNLDPKIRLERVKPYHRLDISAAYSFKISKYDALFSASVFNLMNTSNVQYIQSVATQVNADQKIQNIIVGNESELLNRTFNLGFTVKF